MRRTWIPALATAAYLGTAAAHGGVPAPPFATNPDPELDGDFVGWHGPEGTESGWVPAPYLDVASDRDGD